MEQPKLMEKACTASFYLCGLEQVTLFLRASVPLWVGDLGVRALSQGCFGPHEVVFVKRLYGWNTEDPPTTIYKQQHSLVWLLLPENPSMLSYIRVSYPQP